MTQLNNFYIPSEQERVSFTDFSNSFVIKWSCFFYSTFTYYFQLRELLYNC